MIAGGWLPFKPSGRQCTRLKFTYRGQDFNFFVVLRLSGMESYFPLLNGLHEQVEPALEARSRVFRLVHTAIFVLVTRNTTTPSTCPVFASVDRFSGSNRLTRRLAMTLSRNADPRGEGYTTIHRPALPAEDLGCSTFAECDSQRRPIALECHSPSSTSTALLGGLIADFRERSGAADHLHIVDSSRLLDSHAQNHNGILLGHKCRGVAGIAAPQPALAATFPRERDTLRECSLSKRKKQRENSRYPFVESHLSPNNTVFPHRIAKRTALGFSIKGLAES